MSTFTFRPLGRADLPEVLRWQRSPAAQPWFGESTLDELRERYGPRIDGDERSGEVRMWVALLGDRPVGYAQHYSVAPPPMPPGTGTATSAVGIDYLLGEDDLVGRGLGPALIRDFVVDVVMPAHPEATHVVASPNHRNHRSIRALEKAGFVQGLWVDEPARPGERPQTDVLCTLDLRAAGDHYAGDVSETNEVDSEMAPRPVGIKVAVIGASGRMGSEAVRAIESADGLSLVGTFGSGDDLGDLAGAEVAVELTVPAASPGNVAHCVERGVHVVVGTTGWDEERLSTLRAQLDAAPPSKSGTGVGVLIAPNFAIGALLMMSFAAKAAPYFESVEVIELHHPNKVDAPSGTAARTAAMIGGAREEAGLPTVPDATTHDPEGARGARLSGIPVHSVRLRGLVAHQEVLLGNAGELLTIRHDSFDRASFMPGIVAAVRAVADHPGLTVGLEKYLGLD